MAEELTRQNTQQTQAAGRLSFNIEGMSCASCAMRIEKIMAGQKGVAAARVNFALKRAYADLAAGANAAELTPALEAAIAKAGYKALPVRVADSGQKDAPAAAGGAMADMNMNMGGGGDFAAHERLAEQKQLRAFWLAFALTLPIFCVEMGGHIMMAFGYDAHDLLQAPAILWAEALLASCVLFIPGRMFFTMGIPPLLRGYPNMHSLVAVGAFAAWGYSMFNLLFGRMFNMGRGDIYFESAAVIITLILLGHVLEARSRGRAGAAIAALAKLAPKTAHIMRGGKAEQIAVSAIQPNMQVLIRPGEKLPVDGTVLEGASAVDESMMTGEAFPIAKKAGDKLLAGTVNGLGTLIYRAESVGDKTVLAQIQHMVEEAQASRLPISALADKITAWFVPAVFGIALLTFIAWLAFAPAHGVGAALIAAVSVLIIACPCAMGLATPVAVIVGTGRAANLGVLFRRGDALQKLCETQVAAFDKTGTLTAGRPQLAFFRAAAGFDSADIKAKIAAAEAYSEHPLAAVFRGGAEGANLPQLKTENFAAIAGKGIKATVGGQNIAIGSAAFMADLGADIAPLAEAENAGAGGGAAADSAAAGTVLSAGGADSASDLAADKGASLIYAAVGAAESAGGKYILAAQFAVHDPIRPNTPKALSALRKIGLHIAVISGDSKAAAQNLAENLGVADVRAEVKPADKAAIIRGFQAEGKSVAFIGDGINDAPALSAANVGLAVGTGTDVAIEAADIVLIGGDPIAVVRAYGISRAVLRNIKQNLFWAFAYNIILIPIAAGILVPFGGFGLSPMLAAAAMALSSLFVIGNALRLRWYKPQM